MSFKAGEIKLAYWEDRSNPYYCIQNGVRIPINAAPKIACDEYVKPASAEIDAKKTQCNYVKKMY